MKVIKTSPAPVDLQGKVGALLIDNGMFGIGEVLRTKVSDYLITDELHGHHIPFAWLEVISAFSMAHGKPRASAVPRGLNEKVIIANVKNGVVLTVGARNQSKVPGLIETKIKAYEYVSKTRIFVKKPLILTRQFISAKNPFIDFPFFLKKPIFTYLTLRKMLTEDQVSGSGKKRS